MKKSEKAKKIGISFCADRIGRSFVERNAERSTVAFSKDRDSMFCFLGIVGEPVPAIGNGNIILSDKEEDSFPIKVSCSVSLKNGAVQEIECVIPPELISEY